ncbi:MAG: glycosyltransferase family 4 protein [Weeksellaceae bacterium]
MNILLISPNSPLESIGGVERYIINVINYAKTQSDINLYILVPTSKESFIKVDGNVTIYHENNLFTNNSTVIVQKDISQKSQQFAVLVETIIKSHKIDIICAENLHGVSAAFCLLLHMVASLLKIPLVLRLHSFASSALQTELINQLMWKKISCVSKSVAGDCFHKGADINTLSTHYLGVNTDEFNAEAGDKKTLHENLKLEPEDKIILTAGRIMQGRKNILKEKGFITLIQAFSKLSPRYPELKLVIAVGQSPQHLLHHFNQAMVMLDGYLKLHHVADKTIVKMFKLEEMPAVYAGSDVFVLASENETFGQVFIEAMASAVPVIGTKVGGIPEIITDSHNGYLVPPEDASILAHRIEKLITNEELRQQFIAAGKKTVADTFTLEKQFVSFFETLKDVSRTDTRPLA